MNRESMDKTGDVDHSSAFEETRRKVDGWGKTEATDVARQIQSLSGDVLGLEHMVASCDDETERAHVKINELRSDLNDLTGEVSDLRDKIEQLELDVKSFVTIIHDKLVELVNHRKSESTQGQKVYEVVVKAPSGVLVRVEQSDAPRVM